MKIEPTIEHPLGLRLVLVPSGKFRMGDDGNQRTAPSHEVTVTRPFYFATTEVTQAQWASVMGNNPSRFRGASRPVERISWGDVQSWLSRANATHPEYVLDLPSEAEWEFACRAGTDTAYSFGTEASALQAHAWYEINSTGTTHPVGTRLPNPWGLHDMHGNVWEWCKDGPRTYRAGSAVDPLGETRAGSPRAYRGGSWYFAATSEESANRWSADPDASYDSVGFRVVYRLP